MLVLAPNTALGCPGETRPGFDGAASLGAGGTGQGPGSHRARAEPPQSPGEEPVPMPGRGRGAGGWGYAIKALSRTPEGPRAPSNGDAGESSFPRRRPTRSGGLERRALTRCPRGQGHSPPGQQRNGLPEPRSPRCVCVCGSCGICIHSGERFARCTGTGGLAAKPGCAAAVGVGSVGRCRRGRSCLPGLRASWLLFGQLAACDEGHFTTGVRGRRGSWVLSLPSDSVMR